MADNNDDCLSVNSDFERIPNTPLERDTDVEDLELEDGQKTPNGFAASESNIDPVIVELMEKVCMLDVKVEGLSNENSELHTQQQKMQNQIRQQRELLVEFKHHREHENAKIELIDNTKDAMWDTSTSQLNVKKFTVKYENEGLSIRSLRGFSTVPLSVDPDLLVHNIHYFEVRIDDLHWVIHVGLAEENYPMDTWIGCHPHLFGIAIRYDGALFQLGVEKFGFGVDRLHKNDVVGCGLMVAQKTQNGEAVKCAACTQRQRVVFFTKNGQLWGTPIPLPSNVPSMLYPAVSLKTGDQVTANFGHHPFKFEIPPAKGLNICGHCCHCKQFV